MTLPKTLSLPQTRVTAEAIACQQLLTPAQVAAIFSVDPKTVTRWSREDEKGNVKLRAVRTPGGHRRYRTEVVKAIYEEGGGVWPF